jgi:hypothetical protein
MECPASDQWRAKVMPEDPADWPPGTDGLVATMIRQQMALAEAREFMDEYADDFTALSKL